jgi:hypothetical protein
MNKNKFHISAIAAIVVLIMACGQPQNKPQLQATRQGENSFSVKGGVHEMTLIQVTPQFPEHEGKAEFMSYCTMCHSLKYISMQPDFSRKTWDAEVTKMIAKYKAPIDTAVGKKIVDYLVAVKGKS